jgi:uncharacterized protein (TIGR00369 family)
MNDTVRDNPTRAFIVRSIQERTFDVALDANPAFAHFKTRLQESREGEVALSFVVGEETLQGHGVLAGGTLASMLDFAMAAAALSCLPAGHACTTISMALQFQRPAGPGGFVARGKVERAGRRVVFTTAQLFDAQERLVASATSSLSVLEGAS